MLKSSKNITFLELSLLESWDLNELSGDSVVELGPGLVLTEGSGLLQGLVNLISINFLKKGRHFKHDTFETSTKTGCLSTDPLLQPLCLNDCSMPSDAIILLDWLCRSALLIDSFATNDLFGITAIFLAITVDCVAQLTLRGQYRRCEWKRDK